MVERIVYMEPSIIESVKKFQMVFEQMSPLIRQMDTGKIEIFGLIESC